MARKREHVALEYEVGEPKLLHAAICCSRLEAGIPIVYEGRRFTLSHTMLEGHRFAHKLIKKGEPLLSWDLPFGYALRKIEPGEYVCNAAILDALRIRQLDFALPMEPNFYDEIKPWKVDEATFQPGQVLTRLADRFFEGFVRPGKRGVGTRNFVVIMGSSSRTSSLARAIEKEVHRLVDLSHYPNIDGVVAAAHTEGGGDVTPNNRDLVLRTLAGFAIHPNVGALLLCDAGNEPVTNAALLDWIRTHASEGYDLSHVPHALLSLSGDFSMDVNKGSATVRSWLDSVNSCKREAVSAAHLKIALQCGGSDAFSGISGNPLAAAVSKIAIEHGGIAQMAETDELIGAEKYFISNVRDLDTAQRFLMQVERFKERAFIHGHSAEGNPSGGNKFRGLYNIVLKSCGAAMKRNPDVRLDYVIEYSELMPHRGFYFMDSPGNDLESIAGQVASGCNMIYFITGNGSITNFPFVPTIKIVTTTGRFKLLEKDMDVNAGRYLDGESMDSLARETYELTLRVCSGERSAGERAGHAQVQIWRNWTLTKPTDLNLLRGKSTTRLTGTPIPLSAGVTLSAALAVLQWAGLPAAHGAGHVSEHIALVLPTSLCSGQIALQIAQVLNAQRERDGPTGALSHVSRFVALPHTEGCGVSSGDSEELFKRTLVGYLLHPIVRVALLLEHGCEKTHNNFFSDELSREGVDSKRFGWASIQLDGGIAASSAKVVEFFKTKLASLPIALRAPATLSDVRIALLASHAHFKDIAVAVVAGGGTVVVPQNQHSVIKTLGLQDTLPTIAYAQRPTVPGLHVMAVPTEHWIELLTGVGAVGVDLFVVYIGAHAPPQTNPFVPSLHIGSKDCASPDADLLLQDNASSASTMQTILHCLSRQAMPRLFERNADFQITRGHLGISL